MRYDDDPRDIKTGGPNSIAKLATRGFHPVCSRCHVKSAVRKITGASGRRRFYCDTCRPHQERDVLRLEPLALRDAMVPEPATVPLPPAANGRENGVHPAEGEAGTAMLRAKRAFDDLARENARLRDRLAQTEKVLDATVRALHVAEARIAEWESLADQMTSPPGGAR